MALPDPRTRPAPSVRTRRRSPAVRQPTDMPGNCPNVECLSAATSRSEADPQDQRWRKRSWVDSSAPGKPGWPLYEWVDRVTSPSGSKSRVSGSTTTMSSRSHPWDRSRVCPSHGSSESRSPSQGAISRLGSKSRVSESGYGFQGRQIETLRLMGQAHGDPGSKLLEELAAINELDEQPQTLAPPQTVLAPSRWRGSCYVRVVARPIKASFKPEKNATNTQDNSIRRSLYGAPTRG